MRLVSREFGLTRWFKVGERESIGPESIMRDT